MEKLRFGVVGTNFITDWVIAGAREDERFELTAVCSRTRERGEEFAAKHGIPHVFTSLDAMAASDEVDAVYIATPNSTHADNSILCMNRGKHVLCEKPMAANAREARRMIEASRRNGVALMEAVKSTLSPSFGAVTENLHRIGAPRRYFASFCQYSSRYDKFKEGVILNAFRPEPGQRRDDGHRRVYALPAGRAVRTPEVDLGAGRRAVERRRRSGRGQSAIRRHERHAAILQNSQFPPARRDRGRGWKHHDRPHTDSRRGALLPASGPASGHERRAEAERLDREQPHDEYYYEIKEFIDTVRDGRIESRINSHDRSLATAEIIDEVRRQLGVRYPADEVRDLL